MIKPRSGSDVNTVKRQIEGCYNKPVTVKLNLGRNKYISFPATVNGIYPSLFTVSPDDKKFLGKTAYSYSEIVCGRVKLTSRSL
ncbi:MAG: hypothetical protein LUI60_01560 [Clostridia bacterium]|nr:hypothetical protein [Clostridia bacterium]